MNRSNACRLTGLLMATTAMLWAPRLCHAAHPLQTEDTGTQGTGNVEFENGLSRGRSDGAKVLSYQPQLSYGASTDLDLILQPSWLRTSSASGPNTSGMGDTNIDVKWRYAGNAPWSLAVRAGASFATSQRGLGMAHGSVSPHVLMVATLDAAPFTVHGNLGYTQVLGDERHNIKHVSGAFMWAANERLVLTAEADADSGADPGSGAWPATLLTGLIYTVVPGLDLDLGYQSSVRGTPANRTCLLGITYRFSP